jgi:hypothetical protein
MLGPTRNKIIFIPAILMICVILIYALLNPLDNSNTIGEFYKSNPHAGPDAEYWGSGGSYFRWQSRQPENGDLPDLNIFNVHSAI